MKKLIFCISVIIACFGASCALADTLTLPEGLTRIEDYAFQGCTDITGEVFIPESVTYIGAYAFEGCDGVDTFIIPSYDISIDDTSFGNTYADVMTYDEYLHILLTVSFAEQKF